MNFDNFIELKEEIKDFPLKDKIKIVREGKGFDRKRLSKATGISISSLQKYELGVRKPKFETLRNIATALDTSVTIFLDGTIESSSSKEINKEVRKTELTLELIEVIGLKFKEIKRNVIIPEEEIGDSLDVYEDDIKIGLWKDIKKYGGIPAETFYYKFYNDELMYYVPEAEFQDLVDYIAKYIVDYIENNNIKKVELNKKPAE